MDDARKRPATGRHAASRRVPRSALWIAVSGLALLLTGCVLQERGYPVPTPTAKKAPATLPALIPTPVRPGPAPTATALPGPPLPRLSLSPWPLHGAPPFTAEFAVHLRGDPSRTGACGALRWRFGDGVVQELPCPSRQLPRRFSVLHTYTEPGTYHARLILTLADGREVESTTQTVVVAVPQPVPWRERGLRWGLWALSLLGAVGTLRWLRRQRKRRRAIGYALVALGLTAFVPPFSYLPDPISLAWGTVGGYGYDPRLPFANRFIVAGDPAASLRPFLDGLIGQTGLDPLDPVQPLARYEFLRVWLPRQYRSVVQVTTRFTYADASQRVYDIPLYQPAAHISGFLQARWRYDGLGRLRTEHRELEGIPFARAGGPVQLKTPQRLALHPQVERLDAANPANWGPFGRPWQHLAWSPQEDAFLVAETIAYERRDLWLVRPDGRPPRRVAEDVGDYAWSPDGRYIVLTRPTYAGAQNRVFVARADGGKLRELVSLERPAFPGLSDAGVWYVRQGDLWMTPYDGRPPRRIAPLRQVATLYELSRWGTGTLVRPTPDGTRIAYSCQAGLCLQDRNGGAWTAVNVPASDLTWSPDGTRLAVVHWDPGDPPATLTVVRRDGTVEGTWTVAPNGPVAAPQWTPDGRWLFVQTFPFNGRRIVVVDTATGPVWDLTPPRWDAWFTLAPDGKHLLLSNGRGGFWMSEVVFRKG